MFIDSAPSEIISRRGCMSNVYPKHKTPSGFRTRLAYGYRHTAPSGQKIVGNHWELPTESHEEPKNNAGQDKIGRLGAERLNLNTLLDALLEQLEIKPLTHASKAVVSVGTRDMVMGRANHCCEFHSGTRSTSTPNSRTNRFSAGNSRSRRVFQLSNSALMRPNSISRTSTA